MSIASMGSPPEAIILVNTSRVRVVGVISETSFISSSAKTGVTGTVTASEGGISQVRSIGGEGLGQTGVRNRRRWGQVSEIAMCPI